MLETLGVVCAIGSFCGGLVGQMITGSKLLTRYEKRITALERKVFGHV